MGRVMDTPAHCSRKLNEPGYGEGGDGGLTMRIIQSAGHGAKKVLNRSVESRAVIYSKLPFASSNDGSADRDRGT